MPTATPEVVSLSSFFVAQKPGQVAGSADQFVLGESPYFRQLGQYFDDQTAPDTRINMIVTANSRAAGVNSAGNRLWSREWAQGYARWLWGIGIGASFLPVDTIRVQHYAAGMTGSPWTFGTVNNVRNTAGYLDLSHFGFGSYTSTSEGAGGGLVMEGTGNAFTYFFEDMTAANLPSGMDQVFGSSGEMGEYLPLTGDSLYRHSAVADNRIAYLKGPNMGTWRWEHVTNASSSAVEGDYEPDDPVNTEVDSSTTTVVSVTMAAADTFSSNQMTFNISHVDFPDVQVGMGFTVFRAGAFRAAGIVSARTNNTFTSKWDLENEPETGDVIYFGEVSIGVEQYEAPATTDRFRGFRITSLTGVTYIMGGGSVRDDGTNGVAIGGMGWSGNGYRTQMDEWPREEWFQELCTAMGIDLCVAHIAGQGSTTDDWFIFLDYLKDAGIETYAASDAQHGINGNTESSQYTTAALAQVDHAAGSAQESAFLGDHWSLWEQGGMDNTAHASVVGHANVARVHLNIAKNLPATLTATCIEAPDIATVPDGTTATAANSGLDALPTGGTWRSYADGSRYIQFPASASTRIVSVVADSELVDVSHFGVELGMRYYLEDGQSMPSDDQHRLIQIDPGGTKILILHRGRSSEDGLRVDLDTFSTVSGTTIERKGDRVFLMDQSVRFGYGCRVAEETNGGYITVTCDGQEVAHEEESDIASLSSLADFAEIRLVDGAVFGCHLEFPIKYWTDVSMESELVRPDRDDTTLGSKRRYIDQITTDRSGAFKVSNPANASFTQYTTGGLGVNRHRIVTTGACTFTLRDGFGFTNTVPFSTNRAFLPLGNFYMPSGGQATVSLGDSVAGDIGTIEFAGDEGTASTRPIKVNGSTLKDDSNNDLVYDQTHRYLLGVVFDRRTNKSALLLIDQTEDTTGVQRIFGGWWNRAGGIPNINKIVIDMLDSGCEIDTPANPAYMDFWGVSSYVHADANALTPELGISQHVARAGDFYPAPCIRTSYTSNSLLIIGRSGQAVTNIDDATDDYAVLAFMEEGRIMLPEWQVNDSANVAVVYAEMQRLIDACVLYGVKLAVGTAIPRPAGGSSSVSDGYRDNQRELNDLVKAYMGAQKRPDLMFWSDVLGTRTDAEAATDFFTVLTDDVHFNTAGDELYYTEFLAKLKPIGTTTTRRLVAGGGMMKHGNTFFPRTHADAYVQRRRGNR